MTLLDQDGNPISPQTTPNSGSPAMEYESLEAVVEQVLFHNALDHEHFLCLSTPEGPVMMFVCPDFKYMIRFDWRDRDASALIRIFADFAMEEISANAAQGNAQCGAINLDSEGRDKDRPWRIPGITVTPIQAARIYQSAEHAKALKEMEQNGSCIRIRENGN